MSDLVAITYPDINQAGVVLNTLKRLMTERVLDIDDAVYVTKDANGEVDLHQMLNLPGVGAAIGSKRGAFWGGLIGALIFRPLTVAAIGAAIGAGSRAPAGKLTDYGIDDTFVKQLSTQMTPNSSAIFVLVRNVTVDKVLPEVSRYGGTVLRTSLPDEAELRLQAALSQQAMSQAPTVPQAGAQGSTATPTT